MPGLFVYFWQVMIGFPCCAWKQEAEEIEIPENGDLWITRHLLNICASKQQIAGKTSAKYHNKAIYK